MIDYNGKGLFVEDIFMTSQHWTAGNGMPYPADDYKLKPRSFIRIAKDGGQSHRDIILTVEELLFLERDIAIPSLASVFNNT